MIGIVYGSSTLNTEFVAKKILAEFAPETATILNVKDATPDSVAAFRSLILVTSTWGAGDLQDDWEDFVPEFESMQLNGKRVALVGLGDQKNYPEKFCDSIGLLFDIVRENGGVIVGKTQTDGYEYKRSGAERDGMFVGLVIDEDNQGDLTDERIHAWIRKIRGKLS